MTFCARIVLYFFKQKEYKLLDIISSFSSLRFYIFWANDKNRSQFKLITNIDNKSNALHNVGYIQECRVQQECSEWFLKRYGEHLQLKKLWGSFYITCNNLIGEISKYGERWTDDTDDIPDY